MNIIVGNANVTKLLQNDTISRVIGEALFPGLMFRAAAYREPWEAAVGQTMDFPMPGLFAVDTRPRTPGVAKTKLTQDFERYRATMRPYGEETEVHMPSNYVTATSLYLEKLQKLGLNAAQTLNRLPRNSLYTAYAYDNAMVDQVAGATVRVSTLNGFRETFDPDTASPIPVSNVNPRAVRINGTQIAQTVIAAVPDDAEYPDGPGTLTFSAAVGFVANDTITTLDASAIVRPNGVPNIDGIGVGDTLNMRLIRQTVVNLRRNSIQGCGDGYFHLHFDPQGELNLAEDNRFQRQIEGLGLAEDPYLSFSVGRAASCTMFSNNEVPAEDTLTHYVQTRQNAAPLARGSGEIGGETTNRFGIPIMKTLVLGGGALVEKYVNETAFMTEAGVSGKIGGMQLSNGRVEIDMDGIRFITKAPSDIYNEFVDLAWSWSGDHVCPSNQLTGRTAARYKRAALIETAFE